MDDRHIHRPRIEIRRGPLPLPMWEHLLLDLPLLFRGATYLAELDNKSEVLDELRRRLREGPVTLVFAAKDEEHKSAVVLKEFLERGPRP